MELAYGLIIDDEQHIVCSTNRDGRLGEILLKEKLAAAIYFEAKLDWAFISHVRSSPWEEELSLDLVDRLLHLLIEVFAKADQRIELLSLDIHEQHALGLDKVTRHIDAIKVDLGTFLVLNGPTTVLVRFLSECCPRQQAEHGEG
jgi:hypothetical protein